MIATTGLRRGRAQTQSQDRARRQSYENLEGSPHPDKKRHALGTSNSAMAEPEDVEAMSNRRVTRSMTRAMHANHTNNHDTMKDIFKTVAPRTTPKRNLSSSPLSPLSPSSIPAAKRRRTGRTGKQRGTAPGSAKTDDNTAGKLGKAAPKVVYRSCPICYVDIPIQDIVKLPCDHEYCRNCVNNIFISSVTHEAYFPPRCCADYPVSLDSVRRFLTAEIVKAYESKAPELETPPDKRVYCSKPTCSTWIPLDTLTGDIATCPRPDCGTRTCVKCKSAAHGEETCHEDEAAKSLLLLAEEKKWRRCPRCQRMVERIDGCEDMSCLCGAAFCYVCGVEWKPGALEEPCECHIYDSNSERT